MLANSGPYFKPNALLTNKSPYQASPWYPDYGASVHVTNSSQNILQSAPYEGPEQIFIGNDQGLKIHSSGSSQFQSPINAHKTFVLRNLLHVPTYHEKSH